MVNGETLKIWDMMGKCFYSGSGVWSFFSPLDKFDAAGCEAHFQTIIDTKIVELKEFRGYLFQELGKAGMGRKTDKK